MKSNPIEQFGQWYAEAQKSEQDETVMSLATVDDDGNPDCRIVLLKGYSEKGFRFFTNYESQKSRQLIQHPYATLVFFWPDQFRQVRVRGSVSQLTDNESAEYFASRIRDSQLSAWASPQSAVVSSREALEWRKSQFVQRYEGQDVPKPPFWGGFILSPEAFEFWQGRDARFHDRHRYLRQENGWSLDRLAP